jgi:predicted O-methyltransferase YrrM
LPPSPFRSPKDRLELLAALTTEDISEQIEALDVSLRVSEILQLISPDMSLDDEAISAPDTFPANRSWTHWHALTWFARRFRPKSYLEISTDLGRSTAMVCLNCPEMIALTADMGRDQLLGRPHFQPARVARELWRSGSRQPLRVLWGDSLHSLPRYWKEVRVNVIQEFDLIFVDGSRGLHGIYHDLKNVFAHTALGGMIVFRGMDRKEVRWPGQYHRQLHGLWDRLRLRYPGFRYLTAPLGREVGLAFRMF